MLKRESKLNPLAEEFVPSPRSRLSAAAPEFFPSGHVLFPTAYGAAQPHLSLSQPVSSYAGSERSTGKDKRAEKESKLKRTVYVGNIDRRVSEEELLKEFRSCGVVTGSFIRGDTRPGLRYGFIEFENEGCARAALSLNCTRIGLYPVRVFPSHTTIAPVNRLRAHDAYAKVRADNFVRN